RRRTHHERKHTRYKCPIKRTPLRVDLSWLRRLRYSDGRARGVPVCLVAESCRWLCRCDFGSLHFTVQKGGRLTTSPDQPDAVNPAIVSWLQVRYQWRGVAEPGRSLRCESASCSDVLNRRQRRQRRGFPSLFASFASIELRQFI